MGFTKDPFSLFFFLSVGFQPAGMSCGSELDGIVQLVCADPSLLDGSIEKIVHEYPLKLAKWVPHVIRELRRRKEFSQGTGAWFCSTCVAHFVLLNVCVCVCVEDMLGGLAGVSDKLVRNDHYHAGAVVLFSSIPSERYVSLIEMQRNATGGHHLFTSCGVEHAKAR
jgi:hypothetical protein